MRLACAFAADRSASDSACIDGGAGNGIAGIMNSIDCCLGAMNGGWELSPCACWWLWWPWWPPWWWWCGRDFGKRCCRLASVVRAKRSLRAFRAIFRRRSMSCMSTFGIETTDDRLDDWMLEGTCGFITPILRKSLWSGLTRILMIGCRTVGKKLKHEARVVRVLLSCRFELNYLAKVKLSEPSPRPFRWYW